MAKDTRSAAEIAEAEAYEAEFERELEILRKTRAENEADEYDDGDAYGY